MPRDIAGFSNPLVKETRSLRDKKHRRASGRFLAEGLRICIEALDAGHAPELLWRTAASADHPLVARLEAAAGDVLVTTPDILGKLSGKDNPGSVIGVYREPEWALGDIQRNNSPLWIVAQALRDPGNLGTILRTGDAVGAGVKAVVAQFVEHIQRDEQAAAQPHGQPHDVDRGEGAVANQIPPGNSHVGTKHLSSSLSKLYLIVVGYTRYVPKIKNAVSGQKTAFLLSMFVQYRTGYVRFRLKLLAP